ncbi:MAG: hypothetical protein E3J86_00895, partial [Candidatus Thorarchaeota archaeon]
MHLSVLSRWEIMSDKKKLNSKYRKYVDQQAHLAPTTFKERERIFRSFPDPDGLNGDHFRKRMKQVSPHTLHLELNLARRFLKWAKMDDSSLSKENFTPPSRNKDVVTVADLYTHDELKSIINACTTSRDRALVQVLYESAARSGELLSMTFERLKFYTKRNFELASIIVSGKTGTRTIPLKASVPSLKEWIEDHPTSKGP